jgi:hypothetical protein
MRSIAYHTLQVQWQVCKKNNIFLYVISSNNIIKNCIYLLTNCFTYTKIYFSNIIIYIEFGDSKDTIILRIQYFLLNLERNVLYNVFKKLIQYTQIYLYTYFSILI